MSRCFPFPPPGYEKKARADDVDLLAKLQEKHKEKRHKKERKDKEKDKKDKERSKDKHWDKKDRKEKHRDKKDKDKNKDENRASDGRKVEGISVGQNGEKIGEIRQQAEELDNKMVLEELGRRIRDEEGAGNRVECVGTDQRSGVLGFSMEKNKAQGDDKRHQKHREGSRCLGNELTPGHNRRRQEGMLRSVEKDMERGVEVKVKNKDKEKGDKKEEKQKDREREKKRKDKDRDKEKKKEKEKVKEKSKEKGVHKQKEHNQLRESVKKEGVEVSNNILKPTSNDSKSSSNEDGKKRKELEMNGFIHESEKWPNKLPRLAPSSHLQVENGRKPEPIRMTIPSALDIPGAPDSKKVDLKKEPKINGLIEACTPSVCLKAPASVNACEIGEASTTRPPHPDVKYLDQIYAVPKMEECCNHGDDQQWLFGSRDNSRRLLKVNINPEVCEMAPQVWAEAMQLQPADICALPYVIPY